MYNLSSLVVLASKSRTLSLTKQNKTNAILKTLYVKKIQQIWRIVANKLSYKYENSFTSWAKQINTTIRQKIASVKSLSFHVRVHTRKNENKFTKFNKTPAQAFTPPADEKKMGTIWILVYYAVYGSGRSSCRDFLVLKWRGGALICKYGI